ncbi:MAG: hypothetical protein ACSHX0_12355 [Akkermansiaceae bacterium]
MKNVIKKIFVPQKHSRKPGEENWEKRWAETSINNLNKLGFFLSEVYFDKLNNCEDHQLQNYYNPKISPLYVQPLDEGNCIMTTKLNGFKSITIGEYPHGESAVIKHDDIDSVYMMDDLGKGTQVCEKIPIKVFFFNYGLNED